MKVTCRQLSSDEFGQALAIRMRVFVDEQNVPPEEEQDNYDSSAVHFGAFADDKMIATGRIVIMNETAKIGRVAVLPEYRNQGVGLRLMKTILDSCRQLGLEKAHLGAQLQAIGFYEKLGFAAKGDVFLDAGIPHKAMWLTL